jgi:predicted transcriptional regulator
VHYGNKRLCDVNKVFGSVLKIQEQVLQSAQILKVFVCFFLSYLDFFLQLAEGSRVSALVLLQKLKNLLDAFRVELETDAVEILRLVLPKLNFSHGFWMLSFFEGGLWVLLENVFNLLLPVDNGG